MAEQHQNVHDACPACDGQRCRVYATEDQANAAVDQEALSHEPTAQQPLYRTLVESVESVDSETRERVFKYQSERMSIHVAAVVGKANRDQTVYMLRKLADWIQHTPEPAVQDPWARGSQPPF